jgi:hypothetical protein
MGASFLQAIWQPSDLHQRARDVASGHEEKLACARHWMQG